MMIWKIYRWKKAAFASPVAWRLSALLGLECHTAGCLQPEPLGEQLKNRGCREYLSGLRLVKIIGQ